MQSASNLCRSCHLREGGTANAQGMFLIFFQIFGSPAATFDAGLPPAPSGLGAGAFAQVKKFRSGASVSRRPGCPFATVRPDRSAAF
jgi:hypothetical protein